MNVMKQHPSRHTHDSFAITNQLSFEEHKHELRFHKQWPYRNLDNDINERVYCQVHSYLSLVPSYVPQHLVYTLKIMFFQRALHHRFPIQGQFDRDLKNRFMDIEQSFLALCPTLGILFSDDIRHIEYLTNLQ